MPDLIPAEVIATKILIVRGKRILLDSDLAVLYGVKTGRLNEQVTRNIKRFPGDFMFKLTVPEKNELVTNCDRFRTLKHSMVAPYAFTEQGVAMLSSVLNSERAVQVNIAIMRAFVKLREMIASHKDLARRLDDLENKYDAQFKVVFDAIRQLMVTPEPKKKKIGFVVRERSAQYRTPSRKAVKK